MTHKTRNTLIEIFMLLALIALFFYFYTNAHRHLQENGIVSGFAFLWEPCGFDLITSLIPFSPTSTYWRVFLVAILNTLFLSGLAIIFATLLGIIIAAMRLSRNWLLIKAGVLYVEFFRNIPLLLQVFFWYFIFLNYLPQPEAGYQLFNYINLNVRGLYIGNFVLIPELMAMFMGLTLYAANYISEHIRYGIMSVPHGQIEAAAASGMSQLLILRLVVLPQARRVYVPPIIEQYVNVIKNSSLGSAIGYPELVSVFAGTVPNQTGQAITAIAMTVIVYFIISLVASWFNDWYHVHTAIIER